MIDIHCHILPAIDDGPPDAGKSIEMAKIAAADGIKTIVASPHFHYGEKPGINEIRESILSLQEKLKGGGVPLELAEGADVKLTYELLEGVSKGDVPTINRSRYFLLELPDILPPNLENFLHSAQIGGLVPIITHPERNYSFLSAPRKLDGLRESGVLIQITAMSITGEFGAEIQGLSKVLMKKGFVDFVASDAHSAGFRRPVLSKAYDFLSRGSDCNRLRKIFFENPEAVLQDSEIRAD